MKKPILSLANLKAAHAAIFGTGADQKEGKKSEEASGEKGETDDAGDEGDGSAEDSEKKADVNTANEGEKEDEKKANTQSKGVFLSTEDYAVVTELASEAVQLREENKGLKAKADLWESYQAALHGVKPGADSAGAKGKEEKSESKDPNAALREKYPNLMAGI